MRKSEAIGDSSVRDKAIQWLARVRSGECTDAERRALDDWLAEDESHLIEYRKIEGWLAGMQQSSPRNFPEAEAARRYRPVFRRWALPVAASLVLAFGGGLWAFNTMQSGDVYRTAKGERRDILLQDGSSVVLNTDTELEIRYSRRSRALYLKHGEALFTVAGDERPFEVIAGNGIIRDLGTRFNVHKQPNGVAVAVIEGSVAVSTNNERNRQHLIAGERISYNAAGESTPVEKIDPEAAMAWNEGRFVFRRAPLEDVIREIGRYHDIRIEVSDMRLYRFDVSGTFRINDVDGLLAAIEALHPVQFRRLDSGRFPHYRALYQADRLTVP